MKETANFGLKKPEENEFYDVNVQNDNMDNIDRVLQEYKDGTIQVGDSAKLGGKDASEYAFHCDGVLTGSESILEKAKTVQGYGIFTFRFEGHDGTDLYNTGYTQGVATVFKRTSNRIAVYLWGSPSTSASKRVAVNYWNGTEWSGWDRDAKVTDLANYLPLDSSGTTTISRNTTVVADLNNKAEDTVWLRLSGKNGILGYFGCRGTDNPVFSTAYTDKVYNLLHTGNKPSGTYTGNGSATSRTVDTKGIGSAVLVTGASSYAMFVTKVGGIGLSNNGDTPLLLSYAKCHYENGILTIATDSATVNASGGTYTYQVL